MASKTPGISKGYSYSEANEAICPICGEQKRTKAGVVGHAKLKHGLEVSSFEELEAVAAGNLEPANEGGNSLNKEPELKIGTHESNKQLRERLERVRLKKSLRAENIPAEPRSPGLFERAGLPEPTEEVATIMGKRAIGAEPTNPQTPGWQKLLDPQVLPVVLGVLQRVFGTQQGGDLSNLQGVLQLFGLRDLRGVLGGASNPPVILEKDIDILGVPLQAGTPVSPEFLTAIVQTASSKGKDTVMAEALTSAVTRVAKLIEEDRAGGGGAPIGGKPRGQARAKLIVCEKCGAETMFPAVTEPGVTVHCSNPECDMSWTSYDDGKPENKPLERQRVIPKEPLSEPVACTKCGQALSTEGKNLGDELQCPICGEVVVLTSGEVPMEALEPKTKEPETLQDRSIRGGFRR